jgi:hypothetical protein
MPVCPAGGEYQLVRGDTPETMHAICTVHGSIKDQQR